KIIIVFICFLCPGFVNSQWIEQELPVDTGIMLSIDFTSSNTGISGGWKFDAKPRARALYTTNSGSNWLLATDPDSGRAYVAVQMFDSQNGYMSGAYNSTVNLTSAVNPNSVYSRRYYEQFFKTQEKNGVAGFPDYRAMFLKTTDHGQTWNTYGVIPEKYTYSQDMDFFDMNTGYMVASIQDLSTFRSGILRTTNSGLTWSELLSLPIDGSLNSVVCTGAERVFVTGAEIRNDSLFGVIMKSTSAGSSWEINYYPDITFEDVFFTNASTGFVVGSNETEQ
ncbi:MAG: hypothetical protein ABI855_17725, partial [Bacteroidota bacterium]